MPMADKTLDVTIPAGMETGMQIRVPGEGEQAKASTHSGDLFVVIIVKEHKFLKRQGNDLFCDVPVSYTQLVLGSTLSVPTLGGSPTDFQMPPGTQASTRFRIKGMGLPKVNTNEIGDLVAVTKLEVPASLEADYKEAIDKLAEMELKYVTSQRAQYKP